MAVHDGHRDRMRKRFLEQGLDGFDDHQVLEMLLYYTISRGDTNELAHTLIKTFGSLSQVLEASVQDLCKVPGVGERTATMLHFAGSMIRYYLVDKKNLEGKSLSNINECIAYLKPYFTGRKNEVVFILCLDSKCKILLCKQLGEGSVNSAAIPIRKIVEVAMASNATSVILAHNHPGGIALPSSDDVATTKQLASTLRSVDVILADHVVFADGEGVSMVQSGIYDPKMTITII